MMKSKSDALNGHSFEELPWYSCLRWKIVIPLFLVTLLVALPLTFYEIHRELMGFKDEVRQRASSVSGVLANQLSVAVALGDELWIERLIESAMDGSESVYCAVWNSEGELLLFQGKGEEIQVLPARRDLCMRPFEVKEESSYCELSSTAREKILEVQRALFLRSDGKGAMEFSLLNEGESEEQETKLVGYLRLAHSLSEGERRVRSHNLWTLFFFLGVTLAIGSLLYFVVDYRVHPLTELSKSASSVAKGNLEQEVEYRGIDEIGKLVRAFNEMVIQLKESRNFNEVVGEHAPLGLVLVDEESRIVGANPYCQELLNKDSEDLNGLDMRELLRSDQFNASLQRCSVNKRKEQVKISLKS